MSRLDSDQGSSTAALEAAANDLHRAGEAGLAAPGSLYERLVQEIDRLRDHYAHIEIPAAAKPLGQGNEHLVFFIPESNRVLREPGGRRMASSWMTIMKLIPQRSNTGAIYGFARRFRASICRAWP